MLPTSHPTFRRGVILVASFYVFMAVLYYLALVIDTGLYHHYGAVLVNHALKGLLSLPIWWILFRYLSEFPIWQRLLVHLITLPAFTIGWVAIYYFICDNFGIYRMQGSRSVWDYYIAILFYAIQFGNFHLYEYYQKLQKQELVATKLGKLTLQSELSALKAQLNPHFLYNVFNTINAAIPNTAKHARDMINSLSDLFRYQLKASRQEYVTVDEELAFVEKYLELEKERFGERLVFSVSIEESLRQKLIPPILLQPIIENAVKHGISPLIEGGEIQLNIQHSPDAINIMISDTGAGIQEQSKSNLLKRGIGLSNTDERLQKMYGKGLQLEDNTPSGLIVRFDIPYNSVVA